MVRPRLSRTNRYLALIAALALLAVIVVTGAYASTEGQRAQVDRDAGAAETLRLLTVVLTDAIRDQEAAVHDYLLSADPEAAEAYAAGIAIAADSMGRVRVLTASEPGLAAAIDALEVFSNEWRGEFGGPAIAAVDAGGGSLLDPFIRAAADDHERIDEALEPIEEELALLQARLAARRDELSNTRAIASVLGLVGLVVVAASALWLLRRYGRALERDAMHAGILNRFTEVTSFARDDTAVATSNLEALSLLIRPDAAVTHVLNRSKDRAIPEAVLGDAKAEVLSMGTLAHCSGLVRGSMYVANDSAAPLSVHCPVYPVDRGTLACVPLSSGETVGAVHLYWERPNALPLEFRASVARITEHAALGIGN